MEIRYHSISPKDLRFKGAQELADADADALSAQEAIRQNNYSYTTLRPGPDGKLYVGTTHMGNRILWIFDPATGTFEDLGYAAVGTEYDIKIHRSLEHDPQKGVLYGVSSGLHSEDRYATVPGAAIFQFDLKTRKIEPLGIPLPHEYTQTITFDATRRLLYGFTYHTFSFYAYHVDERRTIFDAKPGSISHLSAIDDSGCIWSTWGRNRHCLFKYDPAQNDIVWLTKKLPEGGHSYMYPGAGPIDCMLNGNDGWLYVALETGSLVRMDPDTADCEYLGRPSPAMRMPALVMGDDELLYGTCGDDWHVSVYTYDRKARSFNVLATLELGDERCFRPHDIALMGNSIYVGETDAPGRSGWLWEITR